MLQPGMGLVFGSSVQLTGETIKFDGLGYFLEISILPIVKLNISCKKSRHLVKIHHLDGISSLIPSLTAAPPEFTPLSLDMENQSFCT